MKGISPMAKSCHEGWAKVNQIHSSKGIFLGGESNPASVKCRNVTLAESMLGAKGRAIFGSALTCLALPKHGFPEYF